MKITKATIRWVDIPLRHPFTTSFTTMAAKQCLILSLTTDTGLTGYGECSAFAQPFYNEEFRDGAAALLQKQLLPRLMAQLIRHPDDIYPLFAGFRRNNMAKAAINCALWDIYAQERQQPLATALGGDKQQVETGVSIGIQASPQALVTAVAGYLADGYRRIKMKIKPGKDYAYLKAVRDQFPTAMLMADANSAYRIEDLPQLQRLDDLNLIMIEQPLEPGDLIHHAQLQAALKTPVCLDESITSVEDTQKMIQLGSGRIINIKVARVGGLTIAKQIQQIAQDAGIACWCGGMLDSGIARAANVAIATLSGYTLPNDIAASERYYDADIIKPTISLIGTNVPVSKQIGLGYAVDQANLQRFTVATANINATECATVVE
ncbi:o-succinylbenzoate synthase [Lactiplantibacillus pentosus]|uniref:o-succinylbenzoate synthase n=1 Tax=Lactiplantibacillus pentosus TaxID=1589 RepID=A0AAW8VXV8_LACPE|nr:o-succinylbenzoate synthase [Lactiplantibacillus pentosus]MBU7463843.1 o-succinylbenzoate synthase [Lactiplantibacillus pentosus]MBU7473029.1 o-succinylbenzoate synthase [Lactiplantibacillus pentosus]MBU7489898.1 o-succinylbenzoate synthase [Lactiplantibacillus pentosus]MBU7494400.1 o-succinylbenzoate synthase [Lactiplantibacillus pentosus]MBU7520422.1 o-succinylbenzoate synthase [Lactiplantibacillus pentosus]